MAFSITSMEDFFGCCGTVCTTEKIFPPRGWSQSLQNEGGTVRSDILDCHGNNKYCLLGVRCHEIWHRDMKVSNKQGASIFKAEERGSKFL